MPLATWGLYLWFIAGATPDAALNWSQRDDWQWGPAKKTSLLTSGFLTPPEAGVYDDTDFQPDDALRAAIIDQAQRNLDPAFFASFIDALAESEAQAALGVESDAPSTVESDLYFHLEHLTARAATAQGDAEAAQRAWRNAAARAPKMVRLSFVDPSGTPVVDLEVGDLVFVQAWALDGPLFEDLTLVEPDAVTDANGYIVMPVFDTPQRLLTRPQPAGWSLQWFPDEYWSFPGRCGYLPPVVVTPRAD